MKKILFFTLVAGAAVFSSYTNSNNKKPQVVKGPEVQVHGGKAFTWVQLNKQGNPEKLGLTLTEEVLTSVPGATPNACLHG